MEHAAREIEDKTIRQYSLMDTQIMFAFYLFIVKIL